MGSGEKRIVFIGLGGASCAGKTTLANSLLRILPPGSFAIHQDDYAPPPSTFPVHPVHGIADWDDAPTAIDWPRLREQLHDIRETGTLRLSDEHKIHEHASAPTVVHVDETQIDSLAKKIAASKAMEDAIYVILDGFVAFWDKEIDDLYAVRLFIREDKEILRHRRDTQRGFPTADGSWANPPGYFDKIVWPAYFRAHAGLFEDGNVQGGGLSDGAKRAGLVLLEASQLDINQMLEKASQAILQQAESSHRSTSC